MKAIILAAGIGRRMKPLTDEKPKCLLEVEGKTLICRQIEILHKNNINSITVVTGYKSDMIKSHLKNTVSYILNPFYETTNSIVSLWLAILSNINDDIIIINSDVIFDFDLLNRIINCNSDINIAISKLWSKERGYKVEIENDCIVNMSMNIPFNKIGGEYAGIIFIKKTVINNLRKQIEKMLYQKLFNAWFEDMVVELIKSGIIASITYVNNDKWYEIDNIEELEYARNKFKE